MIESVAIIGAGASGAITAAALQAERYFKRIRVFERRETAGGTWIYDEGVSPAHLVRPGALPADSDPRLEIPSSLPCVSPPTKQNRYHETPIYELLTTNVPDIAMAYSDIPFPYGPFVPHHIPRQYIENYFSAHRIDSLLQLNTTVEDVSKVVAQSPEKADGWNLTLRQHDPTQNLDIWWEESFDAVILANGHYSIPYIPQVKGLDEYLEQFPGRVVHSKTYRKPEVWTNKKVVVVGNSASGIDVSRELIQAAQQPIYQSRRSKGRWDGDSPPAGMVWKPIITEFLSSGRILFSDGSYLDEVDAVIYCTGYKPSFPFWNEKRNGRLIFDYQENKLINTYWHTFFQDFPTLGIVGMPRVLTFRGMEYQATALARLFSNRLSTPLPSLAEQKNWEKERLERCRREHLKFHDVPWGGGQTTAWFQKLFDFAGLGTLAGDGRIPPVLDERTKWAIKHIQKYKPANQDSEANNNDQILYHLFEQRDRQLEGPIQ
ncbi:hypothetical protein B0I35DRAFT_455032 [Stachybotrys elegans]|uniref:Thiol-specific monooxygenase n=1 Tax=Stachybotrys elegans TaxID=80388 RepID=A0A8K0WKB6_9HYPO|nr:hypothetical protein B0I35DRAFT_455032 [Stachybotrys elegans]